MKIYKRKLQMWPIILILILNATCFFVKPITQVISPVNNYHNKFLIVLIVLLLFILYTIKGYFKKFSSIDLMIISFFIIVLMILIIQIIQQKDSVFALCGNMYFYFIYLLYFPLKRICNTSKYDLIKVLIYTGVIYTIANLLIFLFLKGGYSYSYSIPLVQYVNSNLRLPQSADIVGFTFVLTMYNLLRFRKNKLKYSLMLLLMGVELLFVAQVRMMLISVMLSSVIIIFYFYKHKFKSIKLISLLFIVSIITIFLIEFLYTGSLKVVKNFIGEGQKYASAMYRLEEIKHYSKFMFMNIIFGFGFTQQSTIIKYALTDIGIFAFIFRYGIAGIVWLIFGTYIIVKKSKFVQDKALFYGLISFFCITFISLSMFDSQRVVMFPILLALANSTINNCSSNAENIY